MFSLAEKGRAEGVIEVVVRLIDVLLGQRERGDESSDQIPGPGGQKRAHVLTIFKCNTPQRTVSIINS